MGVNEEDADEDDEEDDVEDTVIEEQPLSKEDAAWLENLAKNGNKLQMAQ